ncbi:3-oxoacyl-ACP synthase [Pyxidicoccus xibeiensis]|uniref:3-oxoacyl-ACP synthase n=1 Tax=Pyxidicoccus xibeiensis TaxID=2906759 RepID=UPI0020A72C0B|nr:3-oxoacyl-ACP synthase [Pyxidicoccus xibeiensis]MCP3136628.1 3-oxoacyl-ACP synthase [Pyxidicoccus xibeiensis]
MSVGTSSESELAITGLGLCTPLGLTARATQAEMFAGTVRFVQTEVTDFDGELLRASRLALLGSGSTRTERMVSLAATALQDCIQTATVPMGERLPLLLALPSPESGALLDEARLMDVLARTRMPARVELMLEPPSREGRAGFFHALARAAEQLRSQRVTQVLVGAVDSVVDRSSLEWLRNRGRVLTAGREGVLPGEGAGFLLLSLASRMGRKSPVLGRVLSHALTREPRHFNQREPCLGAGLTEAFRRLRLHPVAGSQRVDHVMVGQTGEAFWAHEFNLAYLRNAALMPEPLTVSLVAETLGDVGASAGAIQLGSALHRMSRLARTRRAPARALVYAGADDGQIGTCVVEVDK